MGPKKIRKLSMAEQLASLMKDFGFGTAVITGPNRFKWEGWLKSSPIGDKYLIRLVYQIEKAPKIFVMEPSRLLLPSDQIKLKHVYNHEKQQLCLYYPKAEEWTSYQYISKTIIPWTIEWLYHYEIWLITGNWTGGGIEHTGGKE